MTGWSFDPAVVRHAFDTSATAFVEVVAATPGDRWDDPGLGVWTVRDLAGHAGRALSTVVAYLDQPAPAGAEVLAHPLDYYAILASAAADPASVAERGRQAGAALGDDPAGAVAELVERARARVGAAPDDAPVATPVGVLRLVDYLPSRVFELVVHRLDLERATGVASPAGAAAGVELSLVVAAGLVGRGGGGEAALLALTGRDALPGGFSVV